VNVHPARITAALDAAKLWGPQVDIQLGGREPMVDEWEAGTRTPTEEQIRALAELTGVPLEWLLQPGPPRLVGIGCIGRGRSVRIYETPPRVEGGLLT
jgi:transcriptional regulator with XRE-family HTH domain